MRIIKQALAMMREEKLFSAIHIAGTAMAIAFTMVMAVVYYIKLAPIYPELNRMRTVYFNSLILELQQNGKAVGMAGNMYSEKALEEWFLPSKNYEYCAPTSLAGGTGEVRGNCKEYIIKGKDELIEVIANYTNADFFKIYRYDFLEGRPLTKQDVENKEKVCVISDDLAEKYFGKGVKAVGKMIEIEELGPWRVVGVIRCANRLTPDSYAQIFHPYTHRKTAWDEKPYAGMYSIVLTVKDNKQLQALKQELDELSARLTESGVMSYDGVRGDDVKQVVRLTRVMETHPMHTLRNASSDDSFNDISNWQVIKHFAGLLFILLFVPALNLCGIVAGRMERRTAEMGVRKTFGARRSTLLGQVIKENLVLTSIGGIIGLTAAWVAIYGMRTEILGMFFDNSTIGSSPVVTGEMLFAPLLFVGAFVAVLVMNVLSALLPAWLSLRKPIVESMMEKR
jgi:putative ABC transport system permease protein